MTFFIFVEFDGPYGRSRNTYGFTTAALRAEYAAGIEPCEGDEWSDCEEWEAPHSEWPHVRIVA